MLGNSLATMCMILLYDDVTPFSIIPYTSMSFLSNYSCVSLPTRLRSAQKGCSGDQSNLLWEEIRLEAVVGRFSTFSGRMSHK